MYLVLIVLDFLLLNLVDLNKFWALEVLGRREVVVQDEVSDVVKDGDGDGDVE